MNILHHKSWHVRNKDNIQRVRRDEAKAAAEEKEKLKRREIAESEIRLDQLRSRSGAAGGSKLVQYEDFLNQKNVNLFEEEELKKNNDDKNEEAELEKKQEKEKYEKKIGLLKYLVDDEMLDLKNQPWYKSVTRNKNESISDETEVDLKRKLKMDPLTNINHLLEGHKKHKKEHRDKKHKHKQKDKKALESKNEQKVVVKKSKTIEELRAERMQRECEERMKANMLLSGNKNSGQEKQEKEVDDRKRKYNNQFNPDFSKI